MANEKLAGKIIDYMYGSRKKRHIANKIHFGLKRVNRGNGLKNITAQQVVKACEILENKGDLECVGRARVRMGHLNAKKNHKEYALSKDKREELDIENGVLVFEEDQKEEEE